MITRGRKHRITGAFLAGLIALSAAASVSACSGKGGGAQAGASPSPTLTDAQIQVVINELVQCIRDNGAPGFPDVKVENGRVVPPDENGVDETTKQNADSAMQSCKSIQERLPPSVFGEGGGSTPTDDAGPGPQDVPALRQFAQCMRENGVPEFPDPQSDGSFPRQGNPLETEGKSPRMVQGFQACNKYYDGHLRMSQ